MSYLSLILPGNDDDSHLLAANTHIHTNKHTHTHTYTERPVDFGNVSMALLSDSGLSGVLRVSSGRTGSQDPSYLAVLDCMTGLLTLSGNDVSWGPHATPWL